MEAWSPTRKLFCPPGRADKAGSEAGRNGDHKWGEFHILLRLAMGGPPLGSSGGA